MLQERFGLARAADRVESRRRARTEPVELREDIPHPVRALVARLELRQCCFVVARLRLDEATEVVTILPTLSTILTLGRPHSSNHPPRKARPVRGIRHRVIVCRV